MPVSVHEYIIYTDPQPPQPQPQAAHHQVPLAQFHPFIFMIVVILLSVRFHHTSIIRHPPQLPPVPHVPHEPFQAQPHPPDPHQISIDLFHCIDIRLTKFHFIPPKHWIVRIT